VQLRARLAGAHHRGRPRNRKNIAIDNPPGIVRVARSRTVPAGPRTQASNASRDIPGVREPEVRLTKGLSAAKIHARIAQAAFSARGRFSS